MLLEHYPRHVTDGSRTLWNARVILNAGAFFFARDDKEKTKKARQREQRKIRHSATKVNAWMCASMESNMCARFFEENLQVR